MMFMILQAGEYYIPTPGFEAFDVQEGAPSEDILAARLKFVKDMKWFGDSYSSDEDGYDRLPNTYHFARRSEEGEILATMRLTQVESVESSLSYGMIAGNPGFQESVRKEGEALEGHIWDLTRLVSPLEKLRTPEVREAMVEMFGMAARVSAGAVERAEENVYWVFTTTPWTLRFFHDTGIQSRTLGEGRLLDMDGKPKTTYFCLVDVAAAIEALKADNEHQATYELLKIGAGEAERAEAA